MVGKWIALIIFCFCSMLLISGGCGGNTSQRDTFHCPSISDGVTFASYGSFTFGAAGPDSIPRRIISDCSWHVFGSHNGGTGETLEVASPNDEVVFVWSFGNFSAFRLTKGWAGQTDRGLRLGDSATMFQKVYPEFTVVSLQLSTFMNGNINVEAHFDQNSFLQELLVGNNFRN